MRRKSVQFACVLWLCLIVSAWGQDDEVVLSEGRTFISSSLFRKALGGTSAYSYETRSFSGMTEAGVYYEIPKNSGVIFVGEKKSPEELDHATFVSNDRVLIPTSAIEKLGGKVGWKGKTLFVEAGGSGFSVDLKSAIVQWQAVCKMPFGCGHDGNDWRSQIHPTWDLANWAASNHNECRKQKHRARAVKVKVGSR